MLSNLLPKLTNDEYELLKYCLKRVVFCEKEKEVIKLLNMIQDRTIVINDFKGE
jgi:hypothetical protein